MLKEDNPAWGVEKIGALLLRGPALPASMRQAGVPCQPWLSELAKTGCLRIWPGANIGQGRLHAGEWSGS